jgi:hypothetical protein
MIDLKIKFKNDFQMAGLTAVVLIVALLPLSLFICPLVILNYYLLFRFIEITNYKNYFIFSFGFFILFLFTGIFIFPFYKIFYKRNKLEYKIKYLENRIQRFETIPKNKVIYDKKMKSDYLENKRLLKLLKLKK